jgi:regulator of sigma E protease
MALVVVGFLLLMAVLNVGHLVGTYVVARLFRFRVLRVALGFGPRLARVRAGDAELNLNLLPIMSYVQIAGMNPFEPAEPDDAGSFANGSLLARASTILAGPVGILAAGWCFFLLSSTYGYVAGSGPASVVALGEYENAFVLGDVVVAVDDRPVSSVTELSRELSSAGTTPRARKLRFASAREVTLPLTTNDDGGTASFGPRSGVRRLAWSDAPRDASARSIRAISALAAAPALVLGAHELTPVKDLLGAQVGSAAGKGLRRFLSAGGAVGVWLALFNVLPMPALNGGRLLFLLLAGAGRRPSARAEAMLHGIGMGLLLLAALPFAYWLFADGHGASASVAEISAKHLRVAQVCARWSLEEPPLRL